MTELIVRIDKEGALHFIYNDEFRALHNLGEAEVTRASYVEPELNAKGDVEWWARIVDGPTLGPFPIRDLALAKEVEWILENKIITGGKK